MLKSPATAEWKVQKAGLRLQLVQGRGPADPSLRMLRPFLLPLPSLLLSYLNIGE